VHHCREQLEESSVYRLESFVVDARSNYKKTDHPYRIEITHRTKIIGVIPELSIFPLFAYNAKSLDALQSCAGTTLLYQVSSEWLF